MGHILHDWDLVQKLTLLRKAHSALPEGGALIVFDMMIDDEGFHNTAGLLMSLNMLIETPGGFVATVAWWQANSIRSLVARSSTCIWTMNVFGLT
jgi:hypothetical protein